MSQLFIVPSQAAKPSHPSLAALDVSTPGQQHKSAPAAFDLVIADQTMPQMTGEMLSEQLRHIRPDIPIILCAGFSPVIANETAFNTCINAFLQKPLTMHELGAAVQRVLTCQPASSIG